MSMEVIKSSRIQRRVLAALKTAQGSKVYVFLREGMAYISYPNSPWK